MPVIYHTGFTPPPANGIEGFKICYYPVLKVEYEISNDPQVISEILQVNPIVLIMSKNAVIGLDKWLSYFGLASNFFDDANFWSVGDRTHACLQNILGIQVQRLCQSSPQSVIHTQDSYSTHLDGELHPRQPGILQDAPEGIDWICHRQRDSGLPKR